MHAVPLQRNILSRFTISYVADWLDSYQNNVMPMAVFLVDTHEHTCNFRSCAPKSLLHGLFSDRQKSLQGGEILCLQSNFKVI